MSARRCAQLAALGLLLASPGTAAAQSEPRAPVVGGGSFASAPILEPGRYADTVLAREYLYYGVRLEAGQRLRVRTEVLTDDETFNSAISALRIELYAPLRDEQVLDKETIEGRGDVITDVEDPAAFRAAPAEPFEEAADDLGEYVGPGVWYFALNSIWGSDGQPSKVEVPVALDVAVEGEAEPAPAATPIPATPTPTPTPARTPAPARDEEGDTGGMGVAAGALGGGLLTGVALGAAAGIARRRR